MSSQMHSDKLRAVAAIFLSALTLTALSAACSSSVSKCSAQSDCGSGKECLYRIGNCDAEGECIDSPSGPQCNALDTVCGCNGAQVYDGCGFPGGYASGPTTGGPGQVCLRSGVADSSAE